MSRVSAEKAELANQRKGVKAALREAKRARERARGEFYELYQRPVESLERRLSELDEDLSGPTEGEQAFAYCENCGRALTEDEASKDPVSEGYFCEDRERCHG